MQSNIFYKPINIYLLYFNFWLNVNIWLLLCINLCLFPICPGLLHLMLMTTYCPKKFPMSSTICIRFKKFTRLICLIVAVKCLLQNFNGILFYHFP